MTMIIDTHAHYIEAERPDRPYADARKVGKPRVHPISFDQLALDAKEAGVDRFLQVTASTMGYDNRYSFEGARARPDAVIGVIGRIDPLADDVEAQVEAFAAQPEALGVRFTLIDPWNADWLEGRVLDRYLAAAARHDLPAHLYAPNKNAWVQQTAERFPGVRFVVDHMGTQHVPGPSAEEVFVDWPRLLALSRLPNVWIKVSRFPQAAMGSERYPYPTSIAHFRRLYEHAGPARLIWGSNYPPVTQTCSYRQALDFVREECTFLGAADKAAILGGNFLRDFCAPPPGRDGRAAAPHLSIL